MSTNHDDKQIILAVAVIVCMALFTVLYVIPNVFGQKFITGQITPVFSYGKMVGFMFKATNNYFLPVALSYPGADIVIDIFNDGGDKIGRLTFLSDSLHDDEEGYSHLARLSPGHTTFVLNFNESSQYLRNYTVPLLEDGQYTLVGNAFGIGIEDGSQQFSGEWITAMNS